MLSIFVGGEFNLFKKAGLLMVVTLLISGFLFINNVRAATPCSTGPGSTPILDVTQQINNDPDSAVVNGDWALDNFTRHIQVWTEGTSTCAQAEDNGTFTSFGTATSTSPEHGTPLPEKVEGTMVGGTHGEIIGAQGDANGWGTNPPAVDCSVTPEICSSGLTAYWVNNYFPGGTYNYGDNWGWTYDGGANGTWVNSATGNTGDITHVALTTVYVDASAGNDANVGDSNHPFATIQAAIAAVATSGTVSVRAGTYPESLLITKPLVLMSSDATHPVITGQTGLNYIVKIDGADNVTLSNLEINGGGSARGANAFDYGIFVNSSGTVSSPVEIKDIVVKNVWNTSANGIGVEASSYAMIHDSNISSFDKRGVRFLNSEGKFYNSEVVGDNVDGTSRVQNLVNLWGGSNVEIYGNKLHNALTTPGVTPTWDSPAILVTSYGGSGSSIADVHNNEIYNSDSGLIVGSVYADPDGSSATVTNNNFHDLNWAINFEKGTATAVIHGNSFVNVTKAVNADDSSGGPATKPIINAENNWWGTASSTEISAKTYGSEVDFDPWWADAAMTTLGTAVAADATSATSTITSATTATATTTAGSVVVDMPPSITITGPASWDGTIVLPVATTTTVAPVPDSGNTATAVASIEVGFGDVQLTFDKAVKLSFAGQAGKFVGYSHGAGTFTQITATCGGTQDQVWADSNLTNGADCKFDSGSDLVVWTKHFSTFTTYTQATIPAPAAPSGGGGGGGGGGVLIYNPAPIQTAVPAQTQNPVVAQINPPATGGQVLGAEAFRFTLNIRLGSKGDEVTELQTRLAAEGLFSLAPTGYFGALTARAVRDYQAKYGIPQTGTVGPLTRAQLNKNLATVGSEGQVAGVSTSAQIEALKAQIANLLTQVLALLQQQMAQQK